MRVIVDSSQAVHVGDVFRLHVDMTLTRELFCEAELLGSVCLTESFTLNSTTHDTLLRVAVCSTRHTTAANA